MAKGLLWYGPVSQECFRKISCHTWGSRSFIWNAALRLLTTSSNWTIFSHLSVGQLHRLSCASVRRGKASDNESSKLIFLTSLHFVSLVSQLGEFSVLLPPVSLSKSPPPRCSVNGDKCLWHVAKHLLRHYEGLGTAGVLVWLVI